MTDLTAFLDTKRTPVVASASNPLPTTTVLGGSTAQNAAGLSAKVSAFGSLNVTGPITALIQDSFDQALDTTNRWNAAGTSAPTSATGSVVLSLTAANSVSSILTSQPTFTPNAQPFILAGQLTLGSAQVNPNAHRFFGTGAVTSYAAATPVTDGHGFEVDVTGALNAVVYVNGTRYVVNSTNPALITAAGSWATNMVMSNYGATLTWPASGTAIVSIQYANGFAYFYMANSATGLDIPIGLASWVPQNVLTPIRIAAITTPAVSTVLATTFSVSGMIMGAIGGTNYTNADPNYPWRQQAVTAGGAAIVKEYSTPELDWQAGSGLTALATTTLTALKAAAGAGIRNYLTGLQIVNTSASVSTTVTILDGAAVIWTGYLPATSASLQALPIIIQFITPLKGTAATALNIQLGTTAASVYYNAQGYSAP